MRDSSTSYMPDDSPMAPGFADATYRRIAWRIMPILFLGFVVSYLDRSNIGFAKLQMQSELGFSNAVYGLGAGIFFIGYFIFEVPSNLLLHRLGARIWIARIMGSWGIISALLFMVRGPVSFYLLRFLLGAAEAGLVPGVILYLTYWFPPARRARMVAVFYTAVAASGIIGGPVSGWLMQSLDGYRGMSGWQWLFIGEGLPSVLMAFVVLRFLDDTPAQAKWLDPTQKKLVAAQLARASDDVAAHATRSAFAVFRAPRMWLLTSVFFMQCAGIVGVGLWLPTLVQTTGVKDVVQIGLLSAQPYVFAIVVMIVHGRHSDRTGERRWHVAVPMGLAALGLAVSIVYSSDTLLVLCGLTVGVTGILCAAPPFWSLPAALLHGRQAAVGIAMVNAIGNLGSFASPFFLGYTRDLTHSATTGLFAIAAGLALGGLLVLAVPKSLGSARV